MYQEFVSSRNVYVDRDQQGTARQLLHIDQPFVTQAHTAQLSAATYLDRFADLLELTPNKLQNLSLSPARTLDKNTPEEFRFLQEKRQFDSATLVYSQTIFGIPVWRAGVAVQIKESPDRVVSSQSTMHKDLKMSEPSDKANRLLESFDVKSLAAVLGLQQQQADPPSYDLQSLALDSKSLVVFRYNSAQRMPASAVPQAPTPVSLTNEPQLVSGKGATQSQDVLPTLPLPPVRDVIREGQHYVCLEVNFALSMRGVGNMHWVAIVEVETGSVLYLRPFVDHVSGMVIEVDPITDTGTGLPSATTAAINAARVSRTLLGLNAPVFGVQSLVGDTIQLSDAEAPTVAPPTEPSGANFNFDSRTNDFAAVNAYYHCDKFFRLTDSMGFTRSGYYGGTSFPTVADHRGSINTTNGVEVNAHCLGTAGGVGILRTTFALADTGNTTNPIGIACDNRVVLHELGGHGVLYNHVHSANFGFSHSAGDSIAVIQNDPGSEAPDRFVSFPWVNIGRRHDRTPASGFGWSGSIALNPFGPLDGGGYNNEQILSTTMFRLYRSIGGDSADLNMKRFAARVSVYLILRAIATLSPATNPANAAGFVSALLTADQGDWVSENLSGGAYSKVIRWAFEKQGLYQPVGTAVPNNNAGAPPAVDVYIDDGRAGEYAFQPNWWSTQSIWNRRHADGGTTHEEPIVGQTNYGYVKVKNRGSQSAQNVIVKAFHANPAAGLSYPNDWIPMTTAQLAAATVAPNSSGEIVVGPFHWTPTHVGHECMFMIVSATGDSSNVDRIAAGDSMPEWRLVPNDNNVGQRNVAPVPGSGTSGLTAAFRNREFVLTNPNHSVARMEVRAVLPEVLSSRGWTLNFVNAGGAAFSLKAGESRTIVMSLQAGTDFTKDDVLQEQEPTIQVTGHADGILVGGMSYLLDPKLTHEPVEGSGKPQSGKDACITSASELLRCVTAQHPTVRKVVMRRINVDIDFDDYCG